MSLAVIVMAGGMGTRMKSTTPKVLHTVLGKPLLRYAIEAAEAVNPAEIVIIIGHESDRVRSEFENNASFAIQSPQLGTGHAVQQAQPLLEGKADTILVMAGDMPLLAPQTFQSMIAAYQENDTPLVMLTIERENPLGFGRVIHNKQGGVIAIVEEADCSLEQKAIRELNVGAYVFKAAWLWENLMAIPVSPKGEYYITDLIGIAVKQGKTVLAELVEDPAEALGINTRVHLAEVEAVLRQRINRKWMEHGVTMKDPATVYIDAEVDMGQDTIIYPNSYLLGQTTVGSGCSIGPNSFIEDSTVGDDCVIRFSVVEQAVIENGVDIGPFGHLRKGAHLANGVHMGNFGEVKNSYLGAGTKIGHFSYLGDTTTGENVNVGAGTITCNYDGVNKNQTMIGDNAFIGSDTMLIAPVTIGKNAITGAGSVITQDIPDDSVAYGVPARVKITDKTDKDE